MKPTVVVQHPAMGPIVQEPHNQEKRAGGDAVIKHLEDGAVNALAIPHENSQGDKSHV